MLLVTMLLLSAFSIKAQDYLQLVDSLEQLLLTEQDSDKRLSIISTCYENTLFNDPDTAYHYVLRFDKEASASGDLSEIARVDNFYGMHGYVTGNPSKAIFHFKDALKQYRALQDTAMIGMMLNNIAAAYEFEPNRENSIAYTHKALDHFKTAHDTVWVAVCKANLATHYTVKGDYDTARSYSKESTAFFLAEGYDGYYGQGMTVYTEIIHDIEGAASALEILETVDADKYFPDRERESVYRTLMCRLLTELDRLDEAEPYCRRAMEVAKDYGANSNHRKALEGSINYHRKMGEYQAASDKQILLDAINDSINADVVEREIESINTKQLMLDSEEEQAETRAALAQSQRESKFLKIMAGLIGLILIFAAVFAWSRIRTNRKLRAQKAIIEEALGEKDLLLREIHHRVKNNLQLVTSLLRLQSRGITDQVALDAVNESRSRVRSMALIHKDLYQFDNLRAVDAHKYVDDLARSLLHSFDRDEDEVQLINEVDHLHVDVDTIVPLGLIINELLTNCLKYAFPDGREGIITVRMHEEGDALLLEVSDDGIGLPSERTEGKEDSFGLEMVKAFSDRLQASCDIESEQGTLIRMRIRDYKIAG